MTRRPIWRRAVAVAVAAAALAWPVAAAADADVAAVPLDRVAVGEIGGWIVVDARLDGHAGRWLLDTGASHNLLSAAAADRLGLAPRGRLRAQTPLGAIDGGEVELPPLAVGAYERRGQRALVVELHRVLGDSAQGLDGVLGAPWFDGQQAELDLRRWVGRFGAPAGGDCAPGLEPVALTRHRGLPVVAVDTGSAIERHVLDTGNPAALIRIESDAADPRTPGVRLPDGLLLSLLGEVRVGPQQRSDVPVLRLAAPALRRELGDAARGLAGTGLLDGARWTLDLAAARLCVERARVETPGGFGLLPQRAGHGLSVRQVLPGSPADRAGIRAGEPIAHWAGLPPTSPTGALWQAVVGSQTLSLAVGEPPRELTLRRAIFAPVAP